MSEPTTETAIEPAKKQPAEELDAEFLDYLATFEGDSEDWTLFADDTADAAGESKAPADPKPAAKPEGDKP